MAEPEFQVVFEGRLVEGADPDQVKVGIAKLFRSEIAKVEPLFSGRRTVVKKDLDEATARKYRLAFARVGAVVVIVDAIGLELPAEDPAPPSAAQREPGPAAAAESVPDEATEEGDEGPSRLAVAEAGRAPPPLLARGLPTAPEDMTMADAGANLVDEPSTVEAPDIDTTHLTLSEPGADLVEHESVPAPEFDLSAFELAPPDAALKDEP